MVNGVAEELPGPGPTSVAAALRAAAFTPKAGGLYSAKSHRLLEPEFAPPLFEVDGLSASTDSPVGPGEFITVLNGSDNTEGVIERDSAVPPPLGLPEVESTLWYPGIAGRDVNMFGAVSGELVGTRRAADPVAPRPERAPVVALTFDDGPDPRWTPEVLALLKEKGIKATFCQVGYLAQRFPDLTRAVLADGHVLCDHTMHHVEHLDAAPHDQVVQEVHDGFTALRDVAGQPPTMYRAPGGYLGPDVIATARADGLRVLHWTIDPHDYERPPPDVLVQRVMGAMRPGAVILFHDGGGDRGNTVAAVRTLIDVLRSQGWAFATPLSGPLP